MEFKDKQVAALALLATLLLTLVTPVGVAVVGASIICWFVWPQSTRKFLGAVADKLLEFARDAYDAAMQKLQASKTASPTEEQKRGSFKIIDGDRK